MAFVVHSIVPQFKRDLLRTRHSSASTVLFVQLRLMQAILGLTEASASGGTPNEAARAYRTFVHPFSPC